MILLFLHTIQEMGKKSKENFFKKENRALPEGSARPETKGHMASSWIFPSSARAFKQVTGSCQRSIRRTAMASSSSF